MAGAPTPEELEAVAALVAPLVEARKADKLTRPDVASRMPRTDQAGVARLESGKVNLTATTLLAWADALGHRVMIVPKRGRP